MATPHWLLLGMENTIEITRKPKMGIKPEKSTKVNKTSKNLKFAFLHPETAFYPSSKPEQGLQPIFSNLQ